MKDVSVSRLGGTCSVVVGILSALLGITYLLLPAEQKLGMRAPDLLPSFAQNPTLLTLQSLELALVGVFGLAIVPAIALLVQQFSEGWTRWVSNLAYLGFGVSAVSNLIVVARLPGIAAAFVAGDAATKAALAPVWRSTLDWFGFWQYGAVGIWILVTSLLAMRGKDIPRTVTLLGVVTAIGQFLIPVAFLFKLPIIFTIVAIVGGIVATVWYVWLGLVVRQHGAS